VPGTSDHEVTTAIWSPTGVQASDLAHQPTPGDYTVIHCNAICVNRFLIRDGESLLIVLSKATSRTHFKTIELQTLESMVKQKGSHAH